MPISAPPTTSLVQCRSSYTRDHPTSDAVPYVSAVTHGFRASSEIDAGSEKATTAWPEGKLCQRSSRLNGEKRCGSPVNDGRSRPTADFTAPFATPDASSAMATCSAARAVFGALASRPAAYVPASASAAY